MDGGLRGGGSPRRYGSTLKGPDTPTVPEEDVVVTGTEGVDEEETYTEMSWRRREEVRTKVTTSFFVSGRLGDR